MTSPSRRVLAVVALLSTGALPGSSSAQQPAWSVDLRAGLSSPKGDLGDLHDEGFFAGIGLGRRLDSRLEVRLEAGFETLERGGRPDRLGGGSKGPLADLWHATVLAALELSDPEAGPWEVGLGAGGGATFFDVGGSPTIEARSGTWWTLQGMLYGGYGLDERWTLFVRIDALLMLEDQQEPLGYLSKETALLNSAGIRLAF